MKTSEITEIVVDSSQEDPTDANIDHVMNLPIIDKLNNYDIRATPNKTDKYIWIALTKNKNVVSVIILTAHSSGYRQLFRTWTHESYRGNNLSGELIVYTVKKLKFSPLLSDDQMSPSAIGRFQKILNNNDLKVSILDVKAHKTYPYTKNSKIYHDKFKLLKSDITNVGSTKADSKKYLWVMENWNINEDKVNYIGEGMMSRQISYFDGPPPPGWIKNERRIANPPPFKK